MAATVWDSLRKTANLTLSGGNLVATSVTSGTNGVSASNMLSGPTYAEFTLGASLTGSVGVGVSAIAWASATLGTDTLACIYQKDGTVKINSVTLATIATFAANDRVDVAVNLMLAKIWFRVAGGAGWNNDVIGNQNPDGGVGGISLATLGNMGLRFCFVATTVSPNQSCTAKFSTAFTGTAPTGYLSNDTIQSPGVGGDRGNAASNSFVQASKTAPQTQAEKKAFVVGGFYGKRFYSPAAAVTTISGSVTEGAVPVSKIVRLYDAATGDQLGYATSDPVTGVFSIPALGRTNVFAVAFDPNTYDAMVFDRLTPV